MSKKVYLANPYGFSGEQKDILLPRLVKELEKVNPKIEVWEPFARNDQINFADPHWAHRVGQANMYDCLKCDAIFAVVNGCPPDEGVMVELGICIALSKPTFLFRDDFRRCTDSGEYPLNLMLFTGLNRYTWENFYYTSLDQINDQNKAFWLWANDK